MMPKSPIVLSVNHHKYELEVHPSRSLLNVLRDDLGLTGTKENCLDAECGVCTVLVDGDAVNSCIFPIMHAIGKEITTIEGVTLPEGLHPLQRAFLAYGAVQCGYCIPGMILSAMALVESERPLTDEDIITGLSGNLCRCTGYTKIIAAVQAASAEMRAGNG